MSSTPPPLSQHLFLYKVFFFYNSFESHHLRTMRGSTNVLAVSALIFIEWTRFCVSFSIAPKSFLTRPSTFLSTEQSSSEFSLLDTKDEYFSNDIPKSDYVVVNQSEDKGEMSSSLETTTSKRPEYGAMAPGTVVQVQIGDLSLARKAWKKRRRTGSPLLVPCSILSVDQRSMVRWNLIFLLEKFGIPKADGIQISSNELVQRYRTFLKSSLQVCYML